MKLVATRKTLIVTAAVVSSRRVPRMRRSGRPGASDASPWICGMTATPVSNPERPSASFGKTSSASPTATSGLPPVAACSAFVQCRTACGWRSSCTTPSITTTAFSTR